MLSRNKTKPGGLANTPIASHRCSCWTEQWRRLDDHLQYSYFDRYNTALYLGENTGVKDKNCHRHLQR